MCWQKLFKVRERLYIDVGLVLSLMHMFYVPKGDADIRMVYNGAASGINECLFAPHFGLPVILYVLRSLRPGYYQADMDVGEMFPNFILGEQLRPYSGVDVTHIRTRPEDLPHHLPSPLEKFPEWEERRTRTWERWTRNWMGLKDSPYRSIQMAIVAKLVSYGDKDDPRNPFQWKDVILNLPGQPSYDPTYPWVYKRRSDGHIATDIYLYVDDGRLTGFNEEQCWAAARRFCSICAYLGIQDAAHKRTTPSLTPGPWAGSVIHTDQHLAALVSQKKWDKTKDMIGELEQLLTAQEGEALPLKRLEQIRGFLIYVSRTYEWMPPYLKGLHLTIDSWREGRNKAGWKVKRPRAQQVIWEWEGEQWVDMNPEDYAAVTTGPSKAPERVIAVPRLKSDVHALRKLFQSAEPSVAILRASQSVAALYLMGDASGKGFGSVLWDAEQIYWESGHYATDLQLESSNFREADNLVTRLEQLETEDRLNGAEVMIFTDNSTFEGCFYKGHSTSEKLTDIILRLRQLQQRTGVLMHVIHVAGTRMKVAGIDGLSRGDLLEGMMKSGTAPWGFLPLSQSADERMRGAVSSWVQSWWRDDKGADWCGSPLKALAPNDWFLLHEINQPRLWIPPPAAMPTVLEVFNDDRMANPHLPHVFAIPRLMTHLWRKQLVKDADLVFTVPCDPAFWPADMHEPLIILVVLPLTFVQSYRGPWVAKGTDSVTRTERQLTRGFKIWRESSNDPRQLHELEGYVPGMWEGAEAWSRSVLLKFLDAQREFPPVRECMVRGLLCPSSRRSFSCPGLARRRGGDRRGSKQRPRERKRKRRGAPDGSSVRM